MYEQVLDPVAGSLGLSAVVAAAPLVVLFVMLGVFKVRAWVAGVTALVLSFLVSVLVYGVPVGIAVSAGVEGAAFGLFPAMWIVVNAIWIYQMTVASGHFDRLREAFSSVSTDQRIQGIIIAFCFGALLEALAGFGAPVAICAVMLVAVGLTPLKAATTALVANTAPVAYGAVALPIITLAQVTGLPVRELAQMSGRQVPILALIVPLLLVFLLDGRRGVRETWPAALVCGGSFAVAQFLMSNFGPVELSDIAASLVSAGCVLGLMRVWQPSTSRTGAQLADEADGGSSTRAPAGGGTGSPLGGTTGVAVVEPGTLAATRAETAKAFAPYAVIIMLFSLISVPAVKETLATTTKLVQWPGFDVVNSSGEPLSLATYKLDWLAGGGTVLLVSGLITMLVLRVSPRTALRCWTGTVVQLRTAIVTVMSVLALSYLMNASGQTVTMGLFLAGLGTAFAVLSPVLGWFGVAVTGSDTSSNSLFGALQVSAGQATGLPQVLLASANTSGGVLGKMISPQNLAVGAAAVGLAGKEGELFRKVLLATVILLPLMCVIVVLQATPVLGWMVP